MFSILQKKIFSRLGVANNNDFSDQSNESCFEFCKKHLVKREKERKREKKEKKERFVNHVFAKKTFGKRKKRDL